MQDQNELDDLAHSPPRSIYKIGNRVYTEAKRDTSFYHNHDKDPYATSLTTQMRSTFGTRLSTSVIKERNESPAEVLIRRMN